MQQRFASAAGVKQLIVITDLVQNQRGNRPTQLNRQIAYDMSHIIKKKKEYK